jgi:hypothetical protein
MFLVVSVIYYLIAIPLSHYVYKVFKSDSNNPLAQAPPPPPENDEQNQGLIQNRERDNATSINTENNAFRGQGVRIG